MLELNYRLYKSRVFKAWSLAGLGQDLALLLYRQIARFSLFVSEIIYLQRHYFVIVLEQGCKTHLTMRDPPGSMDSAAAVVGPSLWPAAQV